MNKIELRLFLRKLGSRRLVEMLGEETVESLDEIKVVSIKESNLVKALLARHGTQIFHNKKIRTIVLRNLPDSYAGYYLDGTYNADRVLLKEEKQKIASKKWGRNFATSNRLLDIFSLGAEYLPPVYVMPPDTEEVLPEIILYPYQRRVKDAFVRKLIQEKDNRLLLHMPTGAGKTRTCIEGLVDYLRSVADRDGYILWLAHTEELCEQAVDSFKKLWSKRGDERIEVIRLWGGHSVPSFRGKGGIVVASLQSVHAMRMSRHNDVFEKISGLRKRCKAIVIDEAHKSIAKTYKASIEFVSDPEKTKIIGLTATPGRGGDDIENKKLAKFFNYNKITLISKDGEEINDPISYLQDKQFLAKVNRRLVKTDVTLDLTESELEFVTTFLDLPESVLRKLASDAQRNALILTEIGGLIEKSKSIIVFALSVQHARLLTELLVMLGVEAKSVDGETSAYDRDSYINGYKNGSIQVLVNYGVLTTGFDAPNTNAIVITRPTGSLVLYSQMIGRGIRGVMMGGNSECELVDIIDNINGFPNEKKAFSYFNSVWEN